MFPYKTNAFYAGYSTRKPLRIRTFVSLVLIALLLALFSHTSVKADSKYFKNNYFDCFNIQSSVSSNLKYVAQTEGEVVTALKELNQTELRAVTKEMDVYLRRATQFATIYNAFCK